MMPVLPDHGQISRCRELLMQNSSSLVVLWCATKYFKIFKYKRKQPYQPTDIHISNQSDTETVKINENKNSCRNNNIQLKMNRHVEMTTSKIFKMGSKPEHLQVPHTLSVKYFFDFHFHAISFAPTPWDYNGQR